MKRNLLVMLAIGALPFVADAQTDDDMYFVPKKKTESNPRISNLPVRVVNVGAVGEMPAEVADTVADYHIGELRDVDEYNRRGDSQVLTRMSGDTLYVRSADGSETAYTEDGVAMKESGNNNDNYYGDNYYSDDFHYSSRLHRYHGYYYTDPFFWDFTYGWYDPWYDPWYGWYAPYYRYGYISWYDWGWGWHCHPGWDLAWGHHGCYHDHIHHPGWPGNFGRPYRSVSHPMMNSLARGSRVGRGAASTNASVRTPVRGSASRGMVNRGQTRVQESRGQSAIGRGQQTGPARTGTVSRGSSSRGTYSGVTSRGSATRGSSSGSSVGSPSRGSASHGGSFGGSSSRGGSFGGGSRGGGRGR